MKQLANTMTVIVVRLPQSQPRIFKTRILKIPSPSSSLFFSIVLFLFFALFTSGCNTEHSTKGTTAPAPPTPPNTGPRKPEPPLDHNGRVDLALDELMKVRRSALALIQPPNGPIHDEGCIRYQRVAGLEFLRATYSCQRTYKAAGNQPGFRWVLKGREIFTKLSESQSQAKGSFDVTFISVESRPRMLAAFKVGRIVTVTSVAQELAASVVSSDIPYDFTAKTELTPAVPDHRKFLESWTFDLSGRWRAPSATGGGIDASGLWLEPFSTMELRHREPATGGKPESTTILELVAGDTIHFSRGCPRPHGPFSWRFEDTDRRGRIVTSEAGVYDSQQQTLRPWGQTCGENDAPFDS